MLLKKNELLECNFSILVVEISLENKISVQFQTEIYISRSGFS